MELHQDGRDVVVIRCAGELDVITSRELDGAVARSLATGPPALRLDLTRLSFFDSSGVRCLVDSYKRCASLRVRLEVVTNPRVERVLSLVGFRSATQVTAGPQRIEPEQGRSADGPPAAHVRVGGVSSASDPGEIARRSHD